MERESTFPSNLQIYMKRLPILIGIIMATLQLPAQQSNDYGLFMGMSQEHLYTILPIALPGTHDLAAGAYYRFNFNPRYAMRFGVNTGMVGGFSLQKTDLHGMVEFNFLPLDPRKENSQVSTFIGAGLGIYRMSPAIPFNLGLKYQVNPQLGLTFEWALRKVFEPHDYFAGTDIPSLILSNWHSFIGVTMGYTIVKRCKTCPFYETTRKTKK